MCVCFGLNTLKESLSPASRGVSFPLQDSLCVQKPGRLSECVECMCVFVACVCMSVCTTGSPNTGFPDLKMVRWLKACHCDPNQAIPLYSSAITETYQGVDVGLESASVCVCRCL